jgi:hypothetical protein
MNGAEKTEELHGAHKARSTEDTENSTGRTAVFVRIWKDGEGEADNADDWEDGGIFVDDGL